MKFSFKIMKPKMVIVSTIITIFSAHISSSVMAQQVNFSGTWNLDRGKTDFGKSSPNSTPIQLNVRQESNSISIERVSNNRLNETHSYSEKLTFNGTTIKTTIGATIKNATIKWSENKKTLIEEADYLDSEAPPEYQKYKGTEVWNLAEDGTLTIDRIEELASGNDHRVMVYHKN